VAAVPLQSVWAMLDVCAPGWKKKARTHNYLVQWKALRYPALPRGEHGRTNPDIQLSHVRKLVRHFGIETCAKEQLPALRQ
jgi:hypothetical protein